MAHRAMICSIRRAATMCLLLPVRGAPARFTPGARATPVVTLRSPPDGRVCESRCRSRNLWHSASPLEPWLGRIYRGWLAHWFANDSGVRDSASGRLRPWRPCRHRIVSRYQIRCIRADGCIPHTTAPSPLRPSGRFVVDCVSCAPFRCVTRGQRAQSLTVTRNRGVPRAGQSPFTFFQVQTDFVHVFFDSFDIDVVPQGIQIMASIMHQWKACIRSINRVRARVPSSHHGPHTGHGPRAPDGRSKASLIAE
jgi:hypothetical protein